MCLVPFGRRLLFLGSLPNQRSLSYYCLSTPSHLPVIFIVHTFSFSICPSNRPDRHTHSRSFLFFSHSFSLVAVTAFYLIVFYICFYFFILFSHFFLSFFTFFFDSYRIVFDHRPLFCDRPVSSISSHSFEFGAHHCHIISLFTFLFTIYYSRIILISRQTVVDTSTEQYETWGLDITETNNRHNNSNCLDSPSIQPETVVRSFTYQKGLLFFSAHSFCITIIIPSRRAVSASCSPLVYSKLLRPSNTTLSS